MTFGQFLAILRARAWVALALLVLAVAGTLAVSLMLPRQYTASASVVVDFKPDPVSAVVFGGLASPAFMATQVDIIRSERVALRVVRDTRLAENPQVRTQWQQDTAGQGPIEQWLVQLLHRQMDVVPARESSVVEVRYRAADPRLAAVLANAFVQAYIETTLELRVDPARQYSRFFESRSREARDTLEKAQARLTTFQRENGIVASDARLDIESARLAELSSQVTSLQSVAAESAGRERQAQGAQGDRVQEVLSNPLLAQLKTDLARAEGRLHELSTRLGDAHPQVREARAGVADLRTRLDQETRKVTGGVALSHNVNRQREAEVRAALDAQRAKVSRLKAQRDEGLVLARDVEFAQRTYDAIQQRHMQASLESQTTQSNVYALTQAVPPIEPSSPRLLLNALLAAIVGALLGLGVVMLLELRDRRLRVIDDVVSVLGLPVIGVIPRQRGRRAAARSAAPLGAQVLALPAAAEPTR